MKKVTILGAGLAGLSASYHLGHQNCDLFEKNTHAYGHIHSEERNGFTWDEGPHVSFTKNEYVKQLFEEAVRGCYKEHDIQPVNYFYGNWIPHPAQSNLFAIPEPIRSECLADFLSSRTAQPEATSSNYQEWLEAAFGKTFTSKFPAVYTKKYWTLSPELLSTEWIGNRVFSPDIDKVKQGYLAKPKHSDHYITKMRYPSSGGYKQFASKLFEGANIKYGQQLTAIELGKKQLTFSNGQKFFYDNLISTIPIPEFVKLANPPEEVRQASEQLVCSELLLINVETSRTARRSEHWLYVYDKEKYSTRINFTELLSSNNSPDGKSGIQVEVYFSKYKKQIESDNQIADKVIQELIEMGLVTMAEIEGFHTKKVGYANVIFDLNYRSNLDCVLAWLSHYGLLREPDDLEPMTDWVGVNSRRTVLGDLMLAGRFGQWKYFWTDDCILRGKTIASSLALAMER